MDKIKLTVSKNEWQMLAAIVLKSPERWSGNDKYHRAIYSSVSAQLYQKLHNKLPNLKAMNSLSISLAEAAILAIILDKITYGEAYALSVELIAIIDQKLT